MPVLLRCACGKLLRARDDLVGKRVKCPGCGAALLVEATPRPAEPDGGAFQQAPSHRPLSSAAAESPRTRRRGLADEPRGQQADEERTWPQPARGNLALWLVIGGLGLIAVGAVVLLVVLGGGGGSPKGAGGPGSARRGGDRPFPQAPQAEPGEGFITAWLLLAPIPLRENQSGAEALEEEQLRDEASLRPRAGDTVRVGDRELTWKVYQARSYFFDFNDFLGARTEDSVGYAVCYLYAPAALRGVQLRTGSDDQARVYLNGQEVLKQNQARALSKDQDIAEVSLRRGVNVLVFKVVNEKLDWSGCARLTDLDGNVLKGLRVTTTPE
jgi:hypothetical protein